MTGPGRDDWDDRRLDTAFQTRFDRPAPPHLRERIIEDLAAPAARLPLLRSFRAGNRDVQRAAARARALDKLRPAIPVVDWAVGLGRDL